MGSSKEPLICGIFLRFERAEQEWFLYKRGMEKQMSFAQAEFAGKRRITRREKFLGAMEKVMPWGRLVGVVEPHYPKEFQREEIDIGGH
jgi:hypothetical protein